MNSSIENELEAMRQICGVLEPLSPPMRARVLLAAALLMCPHALDDAAILRAFRQARREVENEQVAARDS